MTRITPIGPITGRRRLAALLRGRCPGCGRGPIFRTFWTSHPACPQCGLRFEREVGYFTGAMYVSYALAVPVMGLCAALVLLAAPQLSFEATAVLAALLFLPFVPFIFHFSRILWIHLDRTIDPE